MVFFRVLSGLFWAFRFFAPLCQVDFTCSIALAWRAWRGGGSGKGVREVGHGSFTENTTFHCNQPAGITTNNDIRLCHCWDLLCMVV